MDDTIVGTTSSTQTLFQKVYGWMCGGLALSGITAYLIATSATLSELLYSNQAVIFIIVIIQLILVISLAGFIKRMSADVAIFVFLLYCLITGITFSAIFLIYSTASISTAFFITAGTFAVMSIYGMATKTDLSKIGQILIMGLIGIIIASIVNIFLGNPSIDYIISLIAIIIFTGLTAYDTQRIKHLSTLTHAGTDTETKIAIIGALTLYLDFINLFLQLLRLFGKKSS